jgi:hypothetical protein
MWLYFGLDVFSLLEARASEVDMMYTSTVARYFKGRGLASNFYDLGLKKVEKSQSKI